MWYSYPSRRVQVLGRSGRKSSLWFFQSTSDSDAKQSTKLSRSFYLSLLVVSLYLFACLQLFSASALSLCHHTHLPLSLNALYDSLSLWFLVCGPPNPLADHFSVLQIDSLLNVQCHQGEVASMLISEAIYFGFY